MTNQISQIFPYRVGDTGWAFDDAAKGLSGEALISGIDRMLNELTKRYANPDKCRVTFSGSPFPGHSVKLKWEREEYSGNWYHSKDLGFSGWLCPALLRFFESAPKEIYVKIDPS